MALHGDDLLAAAEVGAEKRSLGAHLFQLEEGAVPPFGSVYGLETWVDRSLAGEEQIASCAGTHSDTIVMKYDYFASLEHPTVCDLRHEAVPA